MTPDSRGLEARDLEDGKGLRGVEKGAQDQEVGEVGKLSRDGANEIGIVGEAA